MLTIAETTSDGPGWLMTTVVGIIIAAIGAVIATLFKRSMDLQEKRENDRTEAEKARENERLRSEGLKDQLAQERHTSLLGKFGELTTGISDVKAQVHRVEERVERHQNEYRDEVQRLHARDQALAVELAQLKGRVDEKFAIRAGRGEHAAEGGKV